MTTPPSTILATLRATALACLVASLALPTAAQTTSLYSAQDIAHAKRAMAIAEKSDLAYDLGASLTTEVGPRPAGPANDAKAVAWAIAKLKALGFDRVWTDKVKVDAFRRIGAHADLVAPYHHHLAVTALGNSISTPDRGITAELAYYPSFEALKADTSDRAKGRIVYIDSTFSKSQDGRGYGQAVGARVTGAIEAAKPGAVAVLIRSIGTDQDRLPHTGTMRYDENVAAPIPAAAVSTPDGDIIRRIAGTGDADKPMQVFLNMKNVITKGVDSYNVLAEWRGTDKSNEVVAIGGHLDSWDLGTGALDDGAGVAITIATVKILKDMGMAPRRTVRVILFANEENGLDGARDYAARYGTEKHQLVSESDLGADSVYRLNTKVDAATRPWLKAIADALEPIGVAWGENTGLGGPDFGPLVSGFQHPAATLAQDATRYFDYHHTANDTLDKIDPVKLKQNVMAWVAMVWLAAQADHSFGGAPKPAPAR
jgi:Zn-dependent M28 family amino/carboxypeptidase